MERGCSYVGRGKQGLCGGGRQADGVRNKKGNMEREGMNLHLSYRGA